MTTEQTPATHEMNPVEQYKLEIASRDFTAPYTVVGFKGGYLSLVAAIKAAKARGAVVKDADGLQCWAPRTGGAG